MGYQTSRMIPPLPQLPSSRCLSCFFSLSQRLLNFNKLLIDAWRLFLGLFFNIKINHMNLKYTSSKQWHFGLLSKCSIKAEGIQPRFMSTHLKKGWNSNIAFSGHLPRKIYVAKIRENMLFAQYRSTLLSSSEIGPLLPSSLNHLILHVSVNVTFIYHTLSPPWKHQGPWQSLCLPAPFVPPVHSSLPLGVQSLREVPSLYTDDSHTHPWLSSTGLPSHSGWCPNSLLVTRGVGTEKERPLCQNQWWPPEASLHHSVYLHWLENFHYSFFFSPQEEPSEPWEKKIQERKQSVKNRSIHERYFKFIWRK